MDEEDGALIEEIVLRLPNIPASIENKQDFAYELVTEIPYIIWSAEDETGLPIKKSTLLKELAETKKKLEKFYKLLIGCRASLKGNLKAAHAINPRINEDCDLKHVISSFDELRNAISSIEAKPRKRPNIAGQQVAKFLAGRFKHHFGITPKSGKGRRPYSKEILMDYDYLCALINETYGIHISYDARTLTFEKRKTSGQKAAKK